ncbi:MAG TPA: FAD-dependent monooxygenase [Candidatus Baltobacteraceae bacterium]|nr:FAD-dependent monooxygenase [Candidatus Baltobacteraceae bacterium]
MLDALVAGAGPAGSAAALLLARAGKTVRIFERSAFPRTKACGEYLSAAAVRQLYVLGVGAQLAARARPVRGVRLHGHGVHVRIDFPQPGWSLPRSVLDETLLDAAVSEGAQVMHARVEGVAHGHRSVHAALRLPDGTAAQVQGRVMLGADGMHSIVARKCGMAGRPRGGSRFALGGHYRGLRALDEYIDMFVDAGTYVAVNPLAGDAANVMLVVPESELQRHRDDAGAFAQERVRSLAGSLLAGAQLENKRIAIGPLSYRAHSLARERVALAGDAACFVDPFTGQGVYLALRCGQLAAECILSGTLRAYERRARHEISARERAARSAARIIGSPLLARGGAALIERAPWVMGPLLRAVTGAA